MIDPKELEGALEAVLFVAADPVPEERLLALFAEDEQESAAQALANLIVRYRGDEGEPGRGLMIDSAAGGLRLVTRPEHNAYLKRFFETSGVSRLSMAALETLAIVGYRQPITGPEIQDLRGKNSPGVLKTLLERRMIRISGRKEVVGKPFLYATTRDFLLHFGLGSLKDLPPLEEFEEAFLGEGDFSGESLPGQDREEEVERQLALIEEEADEDPRPRTADFLLVKAVNAGSEELPAGDRGDELQRVDLVGGVVENPAGDTEEPGE